MKTIGECSKSSEIVIAAATDSARLERIEQLTRISSPLIDELSNIGDSGTLVAIPHRDSCTPRRAIAVACMTVLPDCGQRLCRSYWLVITAAKLHTSEIECVGALVVHCKFAAVSPGTPCRLPLAAPTVSGRNCLARADSPSASLASA